MLRNVTGNFADLAVELGGEGAKTTVPVPEHGTMMLVGIFLGTKKLVWRSYTADSQCHSKRGVSYAFATGFCVFHFIILTHLL